MSVKKSVTGRTAAATPASSPAPQTEKKKQTDQTRETIEAIAIAFVMAFLFKTFQAELYVIPTGSMAPTLYGRHKEVVCDACQYSYAVGASQEIDQESGIVRDRLNSSECPNCRHINDIMDAPVFNGDRILVNKQSGGYQRFDVVVFKNPEEPHVNYIKRLVGLPGESIRIRQGDIYSRRADNEPWRIQRKSDLRKQMDIQLIVYDDRHPPRALLEAGYPERWAGATLVTENAVNNADQTVTQTLAWVPEETPWASSSEDRSYAISSNDGKQHWLRYRHLVPGQDVWREFENTGKVTRIPEPSLVVDFCGFNAFSMVNHSVSRNDYDDSGMFWVGDLTLNSTIEIKSATEKSRIVFELVKGGRWYRCEWLPATGKVELFLIDRTIDRDQAEAVLLTSIQSSAIGTGTWDWAFANVDDRLSVTIDGSALELGAAVEFDQADASIPSAADTAPAGIAATDVEVVVSDLVLRRDIYYRNDTMAYLRDDQSELGPGFEPSYQVMLSEIPDHSAYELLNSLHSPGIYARRYAEMSHQQLEEFGELFEYHLESDEYLMFGDNSPASKDSRLFDYYTRPLRGEYSNRFAVREEDLIGKAQFIFWPHAVPFMNGGKGFAVMNHREEQRGKGIVRGEYPMYRFPFYPQFSRMKKIR